MHSASTPESAITPERLAQFDEESIAVLARRLDDDDYPTPLQASPTGTS